MRFTPPFTHLLGMSAGIGFGFVIFSHNPPETRLETQTPEPIPVIENAAIPITSTNGVGSFESTWHSIVSTAPGPDRTSAMSTLLAQGVLSDLAKAWQAAEVLNEPVEQLTARQFVLVHAARINPHQALLWLALHPEAATRDLIEILAPRIPAETLEEAIRWTDRLPDALQARATALMISRWSLREPSETTRMIEGLSETPGHDERVRSFAIAAVLDDPVTAMQWSRTISDKQLRAVTQRELLNRWTAIDPLTVKRWIHHPSSGTSTESTHWQDWLDQAELTDY